MIKIDLYNQTGDRDMVPIPIDASDEETFAAIRKSQNRDLLDANGDYLNPTIRFKADDYAVEFQIFRINFKPSSYNDFVNVEPVVIETATATAINSRVLPNTKYYYMFRSVDVHDHISNPSVVYEVEIVKEGDMFFILSDTIELEEKPKPLVPTKAMKRFLTLNPAGHQDVMNSAIFGPEYTSVDDLDLSNGVNIFGNGQIESIFEDKKFKFRVTSKTTGRKLDLNIQFKIEYDKTKKEFV